MSLPPLPKVMSFMSALLFGEGVSIERRKKRVEICYECPMMIIDGCNKPRCSICHCQIEWLARYEEKPGKYGCQHPDGSQWLKNAA